LVAGVAPIAAIWVGRNGLGDFQWIRAQHILIFKRSFTDVWPLWVRVHAAPEPGVWIRYFVAAFVIIAFPEIGRTPDMCVPKVREIMPGVLKRLDIREQQQSPCGSTGG
jgi:hypothetical protein